MQVTAAIVVVRNSSQFLWISLWPERGKQIYLFTGQRVDLD